MRIFKIILFVYTIFLYLINANGMRSALIQSGCIITGVTILLNLILSDKYNNRIMWLYLICLLRLPVKDYFLIFPGVPFRLLSAEIVSRFFYLFGIDSVTVNSVLVFDTNATNIDYPCSGSATIYYLLIFIFIICFFKNINIGKVFLLNTLFSCFLAFILNISRIIILITLSFNKYMNAALFDGIHQAVGILNFILICILFIFLTHRQNKQPNPVSHSTADSSSPSECSNTFIIIALILIIMSFPCFLHKEKTGTKFEIVKSPIYKNLELSPIELKLFGKYGAKVQKYKINDIIIVKITSSNFRSLHNPIVCLRNQGFNIKKEEVCITKNNSTVRCLITDKGYIYYFFYDGNKINDDYYKGIFNIAFKTSKELSVVIIYSQSYLDINKIMEWRLFSHGDNIVNEAQDE